MLYRQLLFLLFYGQLNSSGLGRDIWQTADLFCGLNGPTAAVTSALYWSVYLTRAPGSQRAGELIPWPGLRYAELMAGIETSEPAQLEAIWIKRCKGGPMDPVKRARLLAGRGIEGNANRGRYRQVTLLSLEGWREVEKELGLPLDPRVRRSNLLIAGLDLAGSRGRTLKIGSCRLLIGGETRPCRLMDEQHAGLQAALDPAWRGGAFAQVLDDGDIRVGDPIHWAEESEPD